MIFKINAHQYYRLTIIFIEMISKKINWTTIQKKHIILSKCLKVKLKI